MSKPQTDTPPAAPREETISFTQRLDAELVRRVEATAARLRSSPRAVVELCLEAHLPVLEHLLEERVKATARQLVSPAIARLRGRLDLTTANAGAVRRARAGAMEPTDRHPTPPPPPTKLRTV